jgi:putative SOS response-associated peptidase YedK
VVEPQTSIFPGYRAPVVRQTSDGERELVMMNWGFVLLQKDRAPHRVTNVRDDKILTSPFWRTSFEQRRCLVPASSYCEPKGEKPATWHWFAMKGDEDRPLFAFPGVWTRYRGPIRKNGENVDQEVFAFMTTEPNELTASVNHERMPVLLSKQEHFDTWLNGSPEEAFALARPYSAEAMRIVQSGADREDLLQAA